MWIKREEYKRLKHIEEETEFIRSFVERYDKNVIGHYKDYVIMWNTVYDLILGIGEENRKEKQEMDDKIKSLEAELAWYKAKYYEAKREQ